MIGLALKILDNATEWAKKRVADAARAHASALGSAGYRLRQQLKEGMKRQAPGDVIWPEPSPWIQYGASLLSRARAQQRRLERRKRAPKAPPPALYVSKGRTPLGKLAGAARYEKTQVGDETRVRIGFLNARLAQLAAYHAESHTVPVTEKMRRLIFAVGLGIGKSTITIPRREHVGAVQRRFAGRAGAFARDCAFAAAAGRDPKAIKPPF